MAFEGRQSTAERSVFSTHHGQAGLNGGGGSDESAAFPFLFIPSASPQDAASYMPWSHAHDCSSGPITSAQSGIENRKLIHSTDCEGETDLQGLVSNILDEPDSQDSYYSDGSLPMCDSIWSPKTLKEELLQYLPSDAKVQHSPTFSPNYVSHDSFSKAQGQSVVKTIGQFSPHSNGFTGSQQCFLNLPNGERGISIFETKKLPPGLSLPNIENSYLSQIQNNKCDKVSVDRKNSQSLNDFLELSDAFKPHCEMNSPYFDPYDKDHCMQSSRKTIGMAQSSPNDISQLVNSFQSFMTDKHDSFSNFPNLTKQMLHHEENTSPPLLTQPPTAMQTQKRLVGDFGTAQREQNVALRNQTFLQDDFQDVSCFSPRSREYFKSLNQRPASLNYPNQFQNNIAIQRKNINMSQYPKHDVEPGKIQSKIMPQVQQMPMPAFLDDGISARLQTQKNKASAKNTHFELQESMQSQKCDRRKSFSALNTQQFMPLYPVNEPRRCPSLVNNSRFSGRSRMPFGCGVSPGMDVVSASDSAALNFYTSDMMTCRGESTSNGIASSVTPPHQGVPDLNFFLDECHEQWRCLERERKRIEAILSKTFHGNWTPAVTDTTYPNTPQNPMRVDNLIIKQIREQAKVASLLEKMESVCKTPLHMNIHTALNRHHMAICITQTRRNEEIANASKHQQQKAESEVVLLVFAINDLAATTRKLCTALWCALQMTLPKPVQRQYHNYEEVTCSDRCSSPFEGYSFRI
ncbi:meiosis-specific coiled-coil domain-containing protein MEIOC [Betta splendens]|uniref:Meiosis-specific coiled-coil domain-containing protein MEIOC n=1 Tax=Betta splendens TaxID=158456 RepID=A0A6P7N6P1_BETSP|nr:meiosis-specific coiled-coil domain-containing protein MEIOC [Betta splendens]